MSRLAGSFLTKNNSLIFPENTSFQTTAIDLLRLEVESGFFRKHVTKPVFLPAETTNHVDFFSKKGGLPRGNIGIALTQCEPPLWYGVPTKKTTHQY